MNKVFKCVLVCIIFSLLGSCAFDDRKKDSQNENTHKMLESSFLSHNETANQPINISQTQINSLEDEHVEQLKSVETEKSYDIVESRYFDSDETMNKYIDITYPQVNGLGNGQIEQIINDEIKNTALKVLELFASLDDMEVIADYLITYASDDILSIYFTALPVYAPLDSLAYPMRHNVSANFLIELGERIGLANIVDINDDFTNSFYDNFYLYGDYRSDEGKTSVDEDIKGTFDLDNLLISDKDYNKEICSYLTEDSLFISIAVRKSAGSYALYKANYSDIEEFLNIKWRAGIE